MTPDRRSEATAATTTPDSKPSPLARASRRWSTLATNLLATGLVVILGFVFGRFVIDSMWTGESTPTDFSASVVGPAGLGNSELLHVLDFGQTDGTFHYQSLAGDYDAVTAALRQRTIELTKSARLDDGPPLPAEAKWLARAMNTKPVAAEDGQWQVFESDGPVPVAVGVRYKRNNAQGEQGQKIASGGRRVVCWSIGLPSLAKDPHENAGDRWALFTFVPGGESSEVNAHELSLTLPPDTQRIMSLRADQGATLVGFKGVALPDDLTRHFDGVANDRGWTTSGGWQVINENWTRLYTTGERSTIHITFARQQNDSIRGLVMMAPPVPSVEEQSR